MWHRPTRPTANRFRQLFKMPLPNNVWIRHWIRFTVPFRQTLVKALWADACFPQAAAQLCILHEPFRNPPGEPNVFELIPMDPMLLANGGIILKIGPIVGLSDQVREV